MGKESWMEKAPLPKLPNIPDLEQRVRGTATVFWFECRYETGDLVRHRVAGTSRAQAWAGLWLQIKNAAGLASVVFDGEENEE